MKQMLFTLVALFSITTFARQEPVYSLKCDSRPGRSDVIDLTVEAKTFIVFDSGEMRMVDVTATAKYDDETEVGRGKYLEADEKYTPRKYKNHKRFQLNNLTNTKEFDSFTPYDQCNIKLMIPQSARKGGNFEAPTVVNCDQSGGSMTLDCVATKIRD